MFDILTNLLKSSLTAVYRQLSYSCLEQASHKSVYCRSIVLSLLYHSLVAYMLKHNPVVSVFFLFMIINYLISLYYYLVLFHFLTSQVGNPELRDVYVVHFINKNIKTTFNAYKTKLLTSTKLSFLC